MRQLVDAIQTSQSGIIHNSQIKIYGEGDITYKVVWYYMALKINVSYMEKDSTGKYLRDIRSNNIITEYVVDSNVKVKCMVHQSSF